MVAFPSYGSLMGEYFRLLRSQIREGCVSDVVHLYANGVLKERISALEQENMTLISVSTTDKRRIQELEEGRDTYKYPTLTEELHNIKDAQESQAGGTIKKRRRQVRREPRFKLPSLELQKTFSSLGDVKCALHSHVMADNSITKGLSFTPSSIIERNNPRTSHNCGIHHLNEYSFLFSRPCQKSSPIPSLPSGSDRRGSIPFLSTHSTFHLFKPH